MTKRYFNCILELNENEKSKMKNTILILLVLIFGTVYSSTGVVNLDAEYSSGLVKIVWQSSVESNVKEFIIEKSSNNVTFNKLTTESPKGSSSSYTVFDMSPHSKDTILYYRIVVLDYDGSRFVSEPVSVSISTAGITATWGSIKAMFR